MRRFFDLIIMALLLVTIYFLFFNDKNIYEYNAKQRAKLAASDEGDIDIAVVWPEEDEFSPYFQGVQLAVDEVNSSGGVMGRKIKIHRYFDNTLEQSQQTARQIAENHDIVAVIGHSGSAHSIPASVTYNYNGLLFMSCFASNPDLSKHGFEFVFRNIPTDKEYATKAALCLSRLGAEKVGVLYIRDMYGSSFTSTFIESAKDNGIDIIFEKSYSDGTKDFRPLIADIRKHDIDWLLLIDGDIIQGATLIKELRKMGVNCPILGGDAFDTPTLWRNAEEAAENTFVVSTFSYLYPEESIQKFTEAYRLKYFLMPPTLEASQGYEAIHILAQAMEKGQSTDPLVVSTTLKYTDSWKGVGGNYFFSPDGDILGKNIFLKVVKNGRFHLVTIND